MYCWLVDLLTCWLVILYSSPPSSFCSRCSTNHYAKPDQTCQKCPESINRYDLLVSQLVPFLLVTAAVSVFMCLTIWWLEHHLGHNLKRLVECCPLPKIAVRQTKEFVIWAVLSAQVMASASSSPLPGLPSWILNVCKWEWMGRGLCRWCLVCLVFVLVWLFSCLTPLFFLFTHVFMTTPFFFSLLQMVRCRFSI